MQIGDTVNLIRKITGEVLPTTLTDVLHKQTTPAVEVRWKSDRYRYKLDLLKDEVIAIDSTNAHRQTMRLWYSINLEHKAQLLELFWKMRKTGRKS
jgi:hypothetical protein